MERFSYENYSVLTKNFILETPILDRLANEWSSLMEVKFTGDIDQLDLLPRAQSREAWNVIIELINNAYRHGAASKIDIDFDFRKKGFLKILAVNNGIHVSSTHGKGSGSSIINVASDGNWSIANNKNAGVVVNVQIEFYGPERATRKQLGRFQFSNASESQIEK
jgi:two-component sensor histidine kinase